VRQTTFLDDSGDGLDLSLLPEGLWVGTASFSSPDWLGGFYPKGLKPAEFLAHYAKQLRTVEIDATWHAMPRPGVVEGWERKVPEGFRFALKVPKVITHERELVDCEAEWEQFLRRTELLGEKRGPLLFQFPYVAKGRDAQEYRSGAQFCTRLERFLPLLPTEGEFVVEVRNEHWIAPPLLDLLRSRGIALALVSYFTMPHPAKLMADNDLLTGSFAYVRFLGHHKQMDRLAAEARRTQGKKRDWDALLVDRSEETRAWIPVLRDLIQRAERVYVYYNNHYAGNAPGSIELLQRCWSESD